MDQEHLMLLARLKISLRKQQLGVVDLERYASDDDYARRVLDMAEEADDESLVMLAVKLRHLRGLLAEFTSPAAKPATTADFERRRAPDARASAAGMTQKPRSGSPLNSPAASGKRAGDDTSAEPDDKKKSGRYLFGARGG